MPSNIYIVQCKLFNMHNFQQKTQALKKILVVSDFLRAFHRGLQVPIMDYKERFSRKNFNANILRTQWKTMAIL